MFCGAQYSVMTLFHTLYKRVHCIYSTGKAQLRISCSNSMASVEVVTPGKAVEINSTELKGKCITPELPLGDIEVC